jgi:hypothetical protein
MHACTLLFAGTHLSSFLPLHMKSKAGEQGVMHLCQVPDMWPIMLRSLGHTNIDCSCVVLDILQCLLQPLNHFLSKLSAAQKVCYLRIIHSMKSESYRMQFEGINQLQH